MAGRNNEEWRSFLNGSGQDYEPNLNRTANMDDNIDDINGKCSFLIDLVFFRT